MGALAYKNHESTNETKHATRHTVKVSIRTDTTVALYIGVSLSESHTDEMYVRKSMCSYICIKRHYECRHYCVMSEFRMVTYRTTLH